MLPLSQVEFEMETLKCWLFMQVWVFRLNFHAVGLTVNPNLSPKISKDVDLINAMFGDMSVLVSDRLKVDADVVCCAGPRLFQGYIKPSSSSKTWVISW